MTEPFFRIQQLEVERERFTVVVPDLSIEKGEIHVLRGPSGSGKSTVLEAIAGFTHVRRGAIWVDSKPILHLPPELRKIGYVVQQKALFPNMSLLENIAFSLRVRGISKRERTLRATVWLGRVGLSGFENKRVDEISGGEAQRVQLARCFIADFPVLLLDEPFSALDEALKQDLRGLLQKLIRERGVACLLVSHDAEDLTSLADASSVMDQGKVTKTERLRPA